MAGTGQMRYLNQIAGAFGAKVAWKKVLNHIDQNKFGKSYYANLCIALSRGIYKNLSLDANLLLTPIESDSPIWVMWWQGENNFPPLVQKCVDSIRRNAGSHPVIVISQSNLHEYVQVPSVILDKLHRKLISVTAFSDIVRFGLLQQYGGLWLDATIFLRSDIGTMIDGRVFFSINRGDSYKPRVPIWSSYWTAYCIGGGKNSPIFRYMYRALTEYWAAYDFLVDYFLIDCTINILFESSSAVRQCFNEVPPISYDIYELEKNLSSSVDTTNLEFNGSIYKLNWKGQHLLTTIGGQETVYSRLIEGQFL
jgi:hypothetical protein